MSTLSQFASAAKGMTGNIEKAYITVFDARKFTNDIQVENARTTALFDLSILSDILRGASGMISSTKNLAGEQKTFTVQFNPSTLHLNGHGGGRVTRTNFAAGGNDISNQGRVRITLDVTLIFDRVDPANAFKEDKLHASAPALVNNAVNFALNAAGVEDYSVQKYVEGFIAAVEDERTRNMVFTWGDLQYIGWLEHVNARYTMFNSSAEPIRALVDLSMVCADASIRRGDMGQWEESYKKAFEGGSTSYVSAAQRIGSLLNVSF